ncbi:MAG: cupin domain-containing protein [bacterium]|nr:cupin domain-containing protein [bacterium]
MKGSVDNIEKLALANTKFRQVLYTSKHTQLVLMSIPVGGEIGAEVHQDVDQFFRVEKGAGKATLDGTEHEISDGMVVLVPAGINHNIVNSSPTDPLQLYTLYSPPNHKDKVEHATKAEAEADNEHFDGQTTE